MTRKLIMTSTVLVGFVLALSSNAWADRGGRSKRNHDDGKKHHYCHKAHHGHHYGWHKGKGNPHRDRYQHRRGHRHWDRDHRWDRDRHRDKHYRNHHRDRYYKGRDQHKRVVEKHVYHHYPKRHRHDDRSSITFTVIDQILGVAVAVSGTH